MKFSSVGYESMEEETPTKKLLGYKKWIAVVTGLLILSFFYPWGDDRSAKMTEPVCPMPAPIPFLDHETVQYILRDPEFREASANKLSRAIQIDTTVQDVMKDYSKFAKFHEYLNSTFPLIFERADVTVVDGYSLIFEFAGKDKSLKPIMLTAHQDTVPIGDPNDWVEDPFSGRYDGKKIFGRGASDCKNLLVGLMEALSKIIEDGKDNFERGVILAFGQDEEKSGFDGAFHIGKYLVEKHGESFVDHIIDEGPPSFLEMNGDYYGMVVTAEKGYLDMQVEITTPGGHSSNPKDHTSIGMISKFLVAYEEDMYEAILDKSNPMLDMLECAAEHGHLPRSISKIALSARSNPSSRNKLLSYVNAQPLFKYNVQTSQAIDIIDGGDKANALPRYVRALINHRIAIGNDFDTIWDKANKHAKTIAELYDIGLTVDGEEIYSSTTNGNMVISSFGHELVTAPITPKNDKIWNTFTGYMKSFYESEVYPEKFNNTGKQLIVTPSIMTGNTDTRHYWKLSDHIYRVQPGFTDMFAANIHGPNEWVHVDTHLQVVAFYYNYITSIC